MHPRLLILSNEPYNGRLGSTNRQRLARAAERAGWAVTFLQTIGLGVRSRKTTDGILVRHAINATPLAAQAGSLVPRRINHLLTGAWLRRNSWDLVVSYDPFSAPLVERLRYDRLVYDCVDAYEFQPQYSSLRDSKILRAAEHKLAMLADVRVATSSPLARRKASDWRADVSLLEGAHELDLVPTAAARRLSGGHRALYVGAFDAYKLDAHRLISWLEVDHSRSLTMAGRELAGADGGIRELLRHPRVRVHKPVDQVGFANLARDADFGIVCLAATPYNLYSFPLKTWDYMMNGLPVLAYNSPALASHFGVLDMHAAAPGDFPPRNDLVAYASQFSADNRFARMVSYL